MKYSLLFLVIIFLSCKSYKRFYSVKNNVCKTLREKTILFAVFVESEDLHPWSEYDIKSTLDSINIAANWIEEQAKINSVNLEINVEFSHKNLILPIKEGLKYKTLASTLFKFVDLSKGVKLIDEWSNAVSKEAARRFPKDTSEIILSTNKLNDRERLIAKLKDIHKTDNIAVMFFVNNYYENEISFALHTHASKETEYAVVSKKEPTVIAHEFLHLFGAWDLYQSPFDRKYGDKRRKRKAMKSYPNEIMAFSYRNIDSLKISPLTEYLIGWDNKLDENVSNSLFSKRWKILEY